MNRIRPSNEHGNDSEQTLLLADLDRALSEIERLVESLAAPPDDAAELAILRARILLVRAALNWIGPDRMRAVAPDWDELLPWRLFGN